MSEIDSLNTGSLVFSATLGRNERPWTLVLLDLKSGHIRYLVDYSNTNKAVAPIWSPDGKSLLYSLNCSCTGIFVVDVDENRVRRIDRGTDEDGNCQAAWSPDGRYIAYMDTGVYPDNYYDIYLTELSGNERRRITFQSGGYPVWTPEGEWIVYYSPKRDLRHFRIRPDGSEEQPFIALDNPRMRARTPTWSPNGTKIAFSAWIWDGGSGQAPDRSKQQVYIADSDGTNAHPVTELANYFGIPIWSPQGDKIAVPGTFSEIYGSASIYIFEEGHLRELVKQNYDERQIWHMWSPDGRYIAYAPFHGRTYEGSGVYVVEVSTGYTQKVSDLVAAYPVWHPVIELKRGKMTG